MREGKEQMSRKGSENQKIKDGLDQMGVTIMKDDLLHVHEL